MKQPNWNNTNRENGKVCLSNAIETYQTDIRIAMECTDLAIFYFEDDRESLCDLAHSYYIKATLLYGQGKKEDSRGYFIASIKKHIEGSKRNRYRMHTFYKFVKVRQDIINSILNCIMLKHPSYFNDPMDCPIAASPQNGIPDIDVLNGLRVGCFGVVKNNEDKYYLDASKWSYYGDFHKGICIEYDFSKLEFNPLALMGEVEYRSEYTTERGIVASGLLTKSCDYKHESEWRIIGFYESSDIHEAQYINIQPSMITKIYLGYKCDKIIKSCILEFKSKNSHIQIYQVQPSENNFYQLCAIKIA